MATLLSLSENQNCGEQNRLETELWVNRQIRVTGSTVQSQNYKLHKPPAPGTPQPIKKHNSHLIDVMLRAETQGVGPNWADSFLVMDVKSDHSEDVVDELLPDKPVDAERKNDGQSQAANVIGSMNTGRAWV